MVRILMELSLLRAFEIVEIDIFNFVAMSLRVTPFFISFTLSFRSYKFRAMRLFRMFYFMIRKGAEIFRVAQFGVESYELEIIDITKTRP